MRFAKIVFVIAAIYGFATLIPTYFLESLIAVSDPPAITHPEFFYGFISVALAWQLVFLAIAFDPQR